MTFLQSFHGCSSLYQCYSKENRGKAFVKGNSLKCLPPCFAVGCNPEERKSLGSCEGLREGIELYVRVT